MFGANGRTMESKYDFCENLHPADEESFLKRRGNLTRGQIFSSGISTVSVFFYPCLYCLTLPEHFFWLLKSDFSKPEEDVSLN